AFDVLKLLVGKSLLLERATQVDRAIPKSATDASTVNRSHLAGYLSVQWYTSSPGVSLVTLLVQEHFGFRALLEIAEVIRRAKFEVIEDFGAVIDVTCFPREVAREIVKACTVCLAEHSLEVGLVPHVIRCLKSKPSVYIRGEQLTVQRLKVYKQLVN